MSTKLKLGATQLKVLTTLYEQDFTRAELEARYPDISRSNLQTLLQALKGKGFIRGLSVGEWGMTPKGIARIENGHTPSSDVAPSAKKGPAPPTEATTTTNAIDAVAELIAENERLRGIIEQIKAAATI